MQEINDSVSRLFLNVNNCSIRNDNVSSVAVGWHIEHSLLVIDGVINQLEKSNPADFQSKFSFAKTIIFLTQKIPRGKGKAPKAVLPNDQLQAMALYKHVELTRKNLTKISKFNKNNFFNHPYFGHLNLHATKKFLHIHTKHHVAIVNDILGNDE